MFQTIRRILVVIFWSILAGAGAWIYQHRAIFQPMEDWVEVLKNKKAVPQAYQGELSGIVTKVIDGDTFQMRDQFGQIYTISLVGVAAPEFKKGQPTPLRQVAEQSKTNLSGLILSNKVTVHITYATPQRSALGFVRAADTNVNVAVAESGWARVKREYIRTLPTRDQMTLIQAERKAQEAQCGLWKKAERDDTR